MYPIFVFKVKYNSMFACNLHDVIFVILFRGTAHCLLNYLVIFRLLTSLFCFTGREKPGHRKNSQCSSTAKQLTQATHYAPENYRDYLDYGMQSGSMKKSVSFNQRNGAAAALNGAEDTSPRSSTAGSISNGTTGGHKSKKDAASWYTRPVHLDIAFPSHSSVVVPRPSAVSPSGGPRLASKATNGSAFSPLDANGMDAAMSPRSGPGNSSLSSCAATSPSTGYNGQTMSLMARPTSAPMVNDRMAGATTTGSQTVIPTNNGFMSPIGHSLTDMFAAGIKGHHRTASASFNDRLAVSDFYMEALASEYFPVTFGLPKPVELEVRQQPHIFNHATSRHSTLASSWRQPRRTKSPGRRRPGSAHSSSSSNSKSSIDKAYLMAVEAPAHGKCFSTTLTNTDILPEMFVKAFVLTMASHIRPPPCSNGSAFALMWHCYRFNSVSSLPSSCRPYSFMSSLMLSSHLFLA